MFLFSSNSETCFDSTLFLEQDALGKSNESKVEGNKLFGAGQYEEALSKYEVALQLVPEVPSSVELRSICYANRAICFLKLVILVIFRYVNFASLLLGMKLGMPLLCMIFSSQFVSSCSALAVILLLWLNVHNPAETLLKSFKREFDTDLVIEMLHGC